MSEDSSHPRGESKSEDFLPPPHLSLLLNKINTNYLVYVLLKEPEVAHKIDHHFPSSIDTCSGEFIDEVVDELHRERVGAEHVT